MWWFIYVLTVLISWILCRFTYKENPHSFEEIPVALTLFIVLAPVINILSSIIIALAITENNDSLKRKIYKTLFMTELKRKGKDE